MENNNKVKPLQGKEVNTVKREKVTSKTLKAWLEQSRRVIEEKLCEKEELETLIKKVKEKWIENNF